MSIKKQFSVTVVLFEDFELLDACCPVGLMSRFPELGITMVGAHVGGVRSYRGVSVAATRAYDDVIESDIILVPGGRGARRIVHDSGDGVRGPVSSPPSVLERRYLHRLACSTGVELHQISGHFPGLNNLVMM